MTIISIVPSDAVVDWPADPENAPSADEIARSAEFFSFGTNDRNSGWWAPAAKALADAA